MKKSPISKRSQTDWKRVDGLEDKDIDLTDLPEISAEKFAQAIVRSGLRPVSGKAQVTLRVDTDVLEWFKNQGKGYQTRINSLLRAYMEAHKPH